MQLSILCVTQGLERTKPFIDHFHQLGYDLDAEVVICLDGTNIKSKGYIESVLDEAIDKTTGDYVLRLDDDEKCSIAMQEWLLKGYYREKDVWHFPRVHLWGNPWTAVMEKYYFPDFQTRLTVRDKAKREARLHAPAPHPGFIAPVALEHWTYLVKTYEERKAIAQSYHRIMHGGDGGEYRASSIEDEKRGQEVTFALYTDGFLPMVDGRVKWNGRTWKGPLR